MASVTSSKVYKHPRAEIRMELQVLKRRIWPSFLVII